MTQKNSGSSTKKISETVTQHGGVSSLLILVEQPFLIPASSKEFIASENFVVSDSETANVKISYVGGGFRDRMLGKVEEPFAGSNLKVQSLTNCSVDSVVIDELGGNTIAKVTLCEMFNFLKVAYHCGHFFYIPDVRDHLSNVSARWSGDGWHLDACETSNPNPLSAANRVVSRI
jgi:hypothetical protein